MSDYISRQAAIDAVEQYYKDKKYIARSRTILSAICQDIKNVIDSLQSAQPETNCSEIPNGWIPVTERLPDISESVLICDIDGDICIGHRTRFGDYYPDFCDDKIESVTAWMPLPEPYREEEQDD